MSGSDYALNCGGLWIHYSFLHSDTKCYFNTYLEIKEDKNAFSIQLDPDFIRKNRWLVDENETSQPFLEFQALMLATGNHLLSFKRALFHGAAFIWQDKAWLFTAPSGTGKTTQLRNWKKMCRKGMRIINGDKPILECRDDGSIWVHSSPWMGKEKVGTPGMSARLGGIILLEQGPENKIRRMKAAKAVRPLFVEFVSYPENIEQIRHQSEILDKVLQSVPVWKLINVGDMDSAKVTRNVLQEYLEKSEDAILNGEIKQFITREERHE